MDIDGPEPSDPDLPESLKHYKLPALQAIYSYLYHYHYQGPKIHDAQGSRS